MTTELQELKEAIENTALELQSAQAKTLKDFIRCIDAYIALETGYKVSVAWNGYAICFTVSIPDFGEIITYNIFPASNNNLEFECVDAGYFTCDNEDLTLLSPEQPYWATGKTDSGLWELQYKGDTIAVAATQEEATTIANKL